jgi:C-terminal processing protease CtpA/Prc
MISHAWCKRMKTAGFSTPDTGHLRMHHRFSRRHALVIFAAALTELTRAEAPKGSFGFVAKVDASGFFNPTLKSVHIESVQPGMPAALAGIAAGDSILEVEGATVEGATASAMTERMKKRPGESVVLRLVRANGETYVVTLVAVAQKP